MSGQNLTQNKLYKNNNNNYKCNYNMLMLQSLKTIANHLFFQSLIVPYSKQILAIIKINDVIYL